MTVNVFFHMMRLRFATAILLVLSRQENDAGKHMWRHRIISECSCSLQ